jgi:hypothetical protein
MKVSIVDVSQYDFSVFPKTGGLTQEQWIIVGDCFCRSEERFIGTVDDILACMWGLIPPTLMSDRAYLWLYHNDLVEQHKFAFIRHSQVQLKRMLKVYPLIVGDCMISNTTGRRWLEWLGAKFDYPNGDLAPFEIKAKAYG